MSTDKNKNLEVRQQYELMSNNSPFIVRQYGALNFNDEVFEQDLALLGIYNEDMQVGGHIATGYQNVMTIQNPILLGLSFLHFQPQLNQIYIDSRLMAYEYLYGIQALPSIRQKILDLNNMIIDYADFYLSSIAHLIVPPSSAVIGVVENMQNLILSIAKRAESAIEPSERLAIELNEFARRTTLLYGRSEALRQNISAQRAHVRSEIERHTLELNKLKRSVNMVERPLNKEILNNTRGFSIIGTLFAVARAARIIRRAVRVLTVAFTPVAPQLIAENTYQQDLAVTHREIDRLTNKIDDLEHDVSTATMANTQISDLQAKLYYVSECSSSLSFYWRSQHNNMVNLSNTVKVYDDVLRVTALLLSMRTTLERISEQAHAIDTKMSRPMVHTYDNMTVADIYSSPLRVRGMSPNSERKSLKYIGEVMNILKKGN